MSKLHHTKYKENYKKYILGTIETGINDEPLKTDQEKIKYIFDRFYSEYGFIIDRVFSSYYFPLKNLSISLTPNAVAPDLCKTLFIIKNVNVWKLF